MYISRSEYINLQKYLYLLNVVTVYNLNNISTGTNYYSIIA